MTFCTDTDLLHWEPRLPSEASFASQTLVSGTGDLVDTTFTTDAGVASLVDTHVASNQVISLGPGTISGCYPIVSVDSATELTISLLYDGLFPTTPGASPTPGLVGTAPNLPFVIRTFWPQRRVVSDLLLQSAGLDPSEVAESPSMLLNPHDLKRACVLGTLQMIYSALAAVAEEPAVYQVRADLYERLYRRAMRSARLELDLNSDGEIDSIRHLNVLHFRRA
jgi:hypothetical protein